MTTQTRLIIDITARKHSGQLARDVLVDNINTVKKKFHCDNLLLHMSFETAEKILNTSLEDDWETTPNPEEKAFFCDCQLEVYPLMPNKVAIIYQE